MLTENLQACFTVVYISDFGVSQRDKAGGKKTLHRIKKSRQ